MVCSEKKKPRDLVRGRGEGGAESSVASAVEKGRRTAHQEKLSARRDVRGGAGRSFEAACGGERCPQ